MAQTPNPEQSKCWLERSHDVSAKGYLRDYCWALARAVWSGFGLTDTLVVVLIVLLFLASWFGIPHVEEHPPGWLVTVLAFAFIGFEVLRSAYHLYAEERHGRERLELLSKPQLGPGELHLAPTFKHVPNKPSIPVTYARLSIRNTSEGFANHCSAKLIQVEFEDPRSGWRTLPYKDTLDMAWSNKAPDSSRLIDLGPQGVDTLDLIYFVQGNRELRIASIIPANYPGLMSLAGEYRLTLQVTSANAGSQLVGVRLRWDFNSVSFPASNPTA
jgi:hypothetical protein